MSIARWPRVNRDTRREHRELYRECHPSRRDEILRKGFHGPDLRAYACMCRVFEKKKRRENSTI